MITCITMLDKKPLMALIQEDRLILLTELNPDNLLQDLYSHTANYDIDTLKFLMRLNIESNISSTVLDDVLKVSDINIRGTILSAVASPNDLVALTNFGVVLGAKKVEVFDYIRVYSAIIDESRCIGVDEWNDSYLVLVKSGESLEECKKVYDVNLKSRVVEFSRSYGIDNIVYLGEYYPNNYEFERLKDTKYYFEDQNSRVKNKLILIDYLLNNIGEVLSQEDEVFPIDLPNEDEEEKEKEFDGEFINNLDFTQEISEDDLQDELNSYRNKHKNKKKKSTEKKSFLGRLFGKK